MLDNDLLHQVSRPARYTGGEWNSVIKDWDKTPGRIALAYPDTYEIGMSNMAIPILYDILNRQPDVLSERVYAPWTDMDALMRQRNIPLFSLESKHPLKEFDIEAFRWATNSPIPTYSICWTWHRYRSSPRIGTTHTP